MAQFEIDMTFKLRYNVSEADRADYGDVETLREMLEIDLASAVDRPLNFLNLLDEDVVDVDVVGRIIED